MEIKGRCLRATGFFPVRISLLDSVHVLGDVRGVSLLTEVWFVEGQSEGIQMFSTSEESNEKNDFGAFCATHKEAKTYRMFPGSDTGTVTILH